MFACIPNAATIVKTYCAVHYVHSYRQIVVLHDIPADCAVLLRRQWGTMCKHWHDLCISSLWPERSAWLHVKMDAADISHCFSNPVKTLSHLSSRHSKVTPTAQLGLASIGDSVEMMNNRACILDASSRRMKPRRVLKHSSKESMPIHHCSPSLRTCDFFRHAIKKKTNETAITKMYFCARRAHTQ